MWGRSGLAGEGRIYIYSGPAVGGVLFVIDAEREEGVLVARAPRKYMGSALLWLYLLQLHLRWSGWRAHFFWNADPMSSRLCMRASPCSIFFMSFSHSLISTNRWKKVAAYLLTSFSFFPSTTPAT